MTTTATSPETRRCERDQLVAGLTSQYHIGRCLGEPGAFGSVFSVQDRITGEKFAAKILKIPAVDSPHYDVLMNLYRKEVDILGSLNHTSIVRLERVIRSASHIYLVMERCMGGDLFDYIGERGGRLPEREAAIIFRQVLDPVVYLHEVAGVAHCDIKLSNIMFTKPKSCHDIKLIDFGLSSRCQAGAVLTGRTGTTAFMAPEQIKQRYGMQVDLWSLGVVLYIMLFGYSPWDPYCTSDNRTIESVVLRGFRNDTMPGHGPWFPKSIPASDLAKDLIHKLMRYNPDHRISASDAMDHPWIALHAPS